MSLGLPTTPRLAVAALLLAATAAGGGTAHAAADSTSLLITVPESTGQLAIDAVEAEVRTTATRLSDGTLQVQAQLPEVSISDNRSHRPGWNYSVGFPAQVTSATSSTTVTAGNRAVQIPSVAVAGSLLDTLSGINRAQGWKDVVNNAAPGLVVANPNALTPNVVFSPEIKLTLPSTTAPGEYRTTITHSVV